jgi:hypothetical protein
VVKKIANNASAYLMLLGHVSRALKLIKLRENSTPSKQAEWPLMETIISTRPAKLRKYLPYDKLVKDL